MKGALMRRLLLTLAVLACFPATAGAATLTATPSTFASVYAGAAAGDTILLSSGSYGTFRGSLKSGEVTIREQDGAAASIALDFNPAANLTLDGLTVTSAEFADSRTKNITVRNSEVTGRVTLRTGELQNASILLEHNRHVDVNVCGGCADGRVWLPERVEGEPSGITIRDSEFTGGSADGIQNGSNGTRIIGNTFHDLTPGGESGAHVDAIQLLGSKNTLIKANFFYRLGDGVGIIMAPDGMEREVIEDNVVAPTVRRPFIDIGSDDGSIVRHNTFADGACEFNLRCGIIRVDAKESCPWADACDPGRGTVIKDNVAGEVAVGSRATVAENSFNLLRTGAAANGNIIGLPTYVGPLTSIDGFRLAAGSLGKGNAPGAYMGLTATSTAAVDGDTTLTGEITTSGGGLIRALGTYAHTAAGTTTTLTKTWTANGSDTLPVTVAQMGVFQGVVVAASRMIFRTVLNATMTFSLSGDQGQVTHTTTL